MTEDGVILSKGFNERIAEILESTGLFNIPHKSTGTESCKPTAADCAIACKPFKNSEGKEITHITYDLRGTYKGKKRNYEVLIEAKSGTSQQLNQLYILFVQNSFRVFIKEIEKERGISQRGIKFIFVTEKPFFCSYKFEKISEVDFIYKKIEKLIPENFLIQDVNRFKDSIEIYIITKDCIRVLEEGIKRRGDEEEKDEMQRENNVNLKEILSTVRLMGKKDYNIKHSQGMDEVDENERS